jgi:hypothetical protein
MAGDDLIRQLSITYDALLSQGDLNPLMRNLDEEVEFIWGSRALSEVPWYGVWRGIAGVNALFDTLWDSLVFLGLEGDDRAIRAGDFAANDQTLYNTLRYHARVKRTGKEITLEAVVQWTVRGGKVVRQCVYEDTGLVLAALSA